jgi:hypothetical protein
MKKRATLLTAIFTIAAVIGMALPAAAADLHPPHKGTVCYGEVCVWHFVNNQTGGDDSELITASVNNLKYISKLETKVLRNVVHYWVTTVGTYPQTLIDASTTNAGRLVLSDFYVKCGCGCGCG